MTHRNTTAQHWVFYARAASATLPCVVCTQREERTPYRYRDVGVYSGSQRSHALNTAAGRCTALEYLREEILVASSANTVKYFAKSRTRYLLELLYKGLFALEAAVIALRKKGKCPVGHSATWVRYSGRIASNVQTTHGNVQSTRCFYTREHKRIPQLTQETCRAVQ